MLKSNLEIQLLSRRDVDARGAEFRAFVLGLRDRDAGAGRYIVTGCSERFGSSLCDLNLENYYVLNLRWTLDGADNAIEEEDFDRSLESQNHAFETIQQIVEDEGGNLSPKEEDDKRMQSPKRMEVELERHEVLSQGGSIARGATEKKRIVAMTYVPPNDKFGHTISGRPWYESTKVLGVTIDSFHSGQWRVRKIEIFTGAGRGSTTHHYGTANDMESWKRISEYLSRMTELDKRDLRTWRPAELDYDDEFGGVGGYGGYPHFHGRGSSVYSYTPPVAEYRVAGDEVGAKIHLEQMERVVKEDPTLKEVLAEADQKKGGGLLDEASGFSASAACGSTRGGSHGGFDCPNCQLPNCSGCQDDLGELIGAYPFIGPTSHLVH